MKRLEAAQVVDDDVQEILASFDLLPRVRDRISRELEEALLYLCAWPGAGHARPDLTAKRLLFWLVSPYFIVYAVEGDTLVVAAILHSARDLTAILRTRQDYRT